MRCLLTLLAMLLAATPSPALAAADPNVEPTSANPDADAPAQLARTPTDAPQAEPGTEAPAEAAPAAAASGAATALPPQPVPAAAPAASLAQASPNAEDDGAADELQGKISAALRMSGQATTPFLVDAEAHTVGPTPFETRLRIEPEIRYGAFAFIGDLTTSTGAIAGLPSEELVGDRTAHPPLSALELREAYLEMRGKTWVLRAGQQAANWGLGLVSNSGKHDPAPGEGFGDARYADTSYRVLVAGRPFFGMGGAWRAIEPLVAADMVVRDDTADYWSGDRALQGIFALRLKVDEDRHLGVYTAVRRQRSVELTDTRGTDALVIDFAGKWQWKRRSDRVYSAGFEVVSISGTSTMARSDTAPEQKIRQFGAALKGSVLNCNTQYYLDLGWASGDQNPFDEKIEGFRFDPNYHVGLVMFDEVLGYQSARASVLARDPGIVGRPPDGVDLLPTRGSVTGAAYLFPRMRYGVADWADIYGGPLFAFTTAKLTDPYSTRVGGGEPKNALGGIPGNYLGTELDAGFQARFKPHAAVQVVTTVEGGLLLPGSAFTTASGGSLGPVGVGRLRLGVNL